MFVCVSIRVCLCARKLKEPLSFRFHATRYGLCMLFLVYRATPNLFILSVCLNLLLPSRFPGMSVFAQRKVRRRKIYCCSTDKHPLKMEAKALSLRAIVDAPLWQVEGHLKCSGESVSLSAAAVEDLLAAHWNAERYVSVLILESVIHFSPWHVSAISHRSPRNSVVSVSHGPDCAHIFL